MTAEGLNGALAGAVSKAQGLFPILPWRRNTDNRLNNLERRKPQPQPNADPKPQPIDDGGKPEVVPPMCWSPRSTLPAWLLVPVCGAGFVIGFCLGYGKKLREKLLPAVKYAGRCLSSDCYAAGAAFPNAEKKDEPPCV